MKLSVALITYNHEEYIAQAIEGALNQKVNFNYEIVIGEDCSTDKTRDIAIRYQKKYPNKIRLLLREKNIGMNENFMKTIDSCRGEYIAYLEGDDCWTSRNKLQKQVDLLENNPDYKFCFHLTLQKFVKDEQKDTVIPNPDKRRVLVFKDFLRCNFIGTCSVVFLSREIQKWPLWMNDIKMMDWPLYLLLLERGGKAGFINEAMGIYRKHEGGVLSRNSSIRNYYNAVEALNIYNKHFKYKYKGIINSSIYNFYSHIVLEDYKRGRYLFVLFNLLRMLKIKLLYSPFSDKNQNIDGDFLNKLLAVSSIYPNFFIKEFVKFIHLANSFLFSARTDGLLTSVSRATKYLIYNKGVYSKRDLADYREWCLNNECYNIENVKREIVNFKYKPKISIITPVYNVDKRWLDKCINSILKQYYDNWELCIYDDASTNKETLNYLSTWCGKDKKIKISFGKANKHISLASNEALKLATGEYVAFLDNDDELSAHALYEVVKLINKHPEADFIYSDEDKINNKGERVEPFFKPDWNKNLFLSLMYTCHLGVYRKKIVDKIGCFRAGYEGSQDYDLVLRLIDKIEENNIFHIPKILYHWRKIETSNASQPMIKEYAGSAAQKAIADYLCRNNIVAHIDTGLSPMCCRIVKKINKNKKVSIFVTLGDKLNLQRKCLKNIIEKTKYDNYEIVLINRKASGNQATFLDNKILKNEKIIVAEKLFLNNLAKTKNFAVRNTKSDYLLFMDYIVSDMSQNWLDEMIGEIEDKKSGVVGAKIAYKNNSIFHAGIIVDRGINNYVFKFFPENKHGYFHFTHLVRNYSTAPSECFLVKRNIFNDLKGFNEDSLPFNYHSTDLCFRVLNNGYYIIYTPYARLICEKSYGEERKEGLQKDEEYNFMIKKWKKIIDNDPNYNINLSRNGEYFRIRTDKINYDFYGQKNNNYNS